MFGNLHTPRRVMEKYMYFPCLYRLSGTVRISLELGDWSMEKTQPQKDRQVESLHHFPWFILPEEEEMNLQNSPFLLLFILKYLRKTLVTGWKTVRVTCKPWTNMHGPWATNCRHRGCEITAPLLPSPLPSPLHSFSFCSSSRCGN